jgi:putative phosphoribosyl transferase
MELPPGARGVVTFAHGACSNRRSPRNQFVAGSILGAGVGTLMLDFEAPAAACDSAAGQGPIDLTAYAGHLVAVSAWLRGNPATSHLRQGLFGSRAGGAAALLAAARLGDELACVVSRGARLDSVFDALPLVIAPTLLVVGGHDTLVVCLNEEGFAKLRCEKQMKLVRGATHLFEEFDALDRVSQLSVDWFAKYIGASHPAGFTAPPGARRLLQSPGMAREIAWFGPS